MMVEIESLNGVRQLIGIESIRRVIKSDKLDSESDDEPLAIISVAGMQDDITLKHSFDAFKRVLDGGGVKIIRG